MHRNGAAKSRIVDEAEQEEAKEEKLLLSQAQNSARQQLATATQQHEQQDALPATSPMTTTDQPQRRHHRRQERNPTTDRKQQAGASNVCSYENDSANRQQRIHDSVEGEEQTHNIVRKGLVNNKAGGEQEDENIARRNIIKLEIGPCGEEEVPRWKKIFAFAQKQQAVSVLPKKQVHFLPTPEALEDSTRLLSSSPDHDAVLLCGQQQQQQGACAKNYHSGINTNIINVVGGDKQLSTIPSTCAASEKNKSKVSLSFKASATAAASAVLRNISIDDDDKKIKNIFTRDSKENDFGARSAADSKKEEKKCANAVHASSPSSCTTQLFVLSQPHSPRPNNAHTTVLVFSPSAASVAASKQDNTVVASYDDSVGAKNKTRRRRRKNENTDNDYLRQPFEVEDRQIQPADLNSYMIIRDNITPRGCNANPTLEETNSTEKTLLEEAEEGHLGEVVLPQQGRFYNSSCVDYNSVKSQQIDLNCSTTTFPSSTDNGGTLSAAAAIKTSNSENLKNSQGNNQFNSFEHATQSDAALNESRSSSPVLYTIRHIPTSRSYLLEHLLLWGRHNNYNDNKARFRRRTKSFYDTNNNTKHARHSTECTKAEETRRRQRKRRGEEKNSRTRDRNTAAEYINSNSNNKNNHRLDDEQNPTADVVIPPCSCCRHRIRRRLRLLHVKDRQQQQQHQNRRNKNQKNQNSNRFDSIIDFHHTASSSNTEESLTTTTTAAGGKKEEDGEEVKQKQEVESTRCVEPHTQLLLVNPTTDDSAAQQCTSAYHSQLHTACREQCRYLPFDFYSARGDDFVVFRQKQQPPNHTGFSNDDEEEQEDDNKIIIHTAHEICEQCKQCKESAKLRASTKPLTQMASANSPGTFVANNNLIERKKKKKHHRQQQQPQHQQQEGGVPPADADSEKHDQRQHRHHHHRRHRTTSNSSASPPPAAATASSPTYNDRIALTKRMLMPARLRWPGPDRLVEDDEKRLIDLPQQHVKHESQEHEQRTVRLAPRPARDKESPSSSKQRPATTTTTHRRFEYDDGTNNNNVDSETPLYVRPNKHRHAAAGEEVQKNKPGHASSSASKRKSATTTTKKSDHNTAGTEQPSTTLPGRLIEEVIVHHTTISETLKTSLDETYLVTPLRNRATTTGGTSRHQRRNNNNNNKTVADDKRPESASSTRHTHRVTQPTNNNDSSRPKSAVVDGNTKPDRHHQNVSELPAIDGNNNIHQANVQKQQTPVIQKPLKSDLPTSLLRSAAVVEGPKRQPPDIVTATDYEKVVVLQIEKEDDLASVESARSQQQQLFKVKQHLQTNSVTESKPKFSTVEGVILSSVANSSPSHLEPTVSTVEETSESVVKTSSNQLVAKAAPVVHHSSKTSIQAEKTMPTQTTTTETQQTSNGAILTPMAEKSDVNNPTLVVGSNIMAAKDTSQQPQSASATSKPASPRHTTNNTTSDKSTLKPSDIMVTKAALVTVKNERGVRGERSSKRTWTPKRVRIEKLKLTISPEHGESTKQVETLDLRNSFAELADDYKKRPNVLRLNLFDGGVKLLQAENKDECKAWIEAININCAMSLPPRLSLSLEADFDSSDLEKLRNNRTSHATLDQHFEILRKHVDTIRELQDRVPDTDRDPDFEDMTWSDFLKMELKKTRVYLRRLERFL